MIIVTVCSAYVHRSTPNYAKCLELDNGTGHDVHTTVLFDNGVKESTDIAAGDTYSFKEQLQDQGTYHTISPLVSVTVSYDRPWAGPISITHQIRVEGVHDCISRVVTDIPGGVT